MSLRQKADMDLHQPPGSTTRTMRRPILLPPGFYDLDEPWEIISCWFGTVVGAGADEPVLVLRGGNSACPIECAVRLNGVGYFTFRDFGVRVDGDAVYGIYCLKDITS